MKRDVFICHASEDKAEVVKDLVTILNSLRVTTWYDDHSLQIGDSLLAKIDEGIALARYGVVVLSPAFFSKKWTREELDGMFSRVTGEGTFEILPVWHNVTFAQVSAYSPILAGKLAANTHDGLDKVAGSIRDKVQTPKLTASPNEYGHQHYGQTIRLTDLPVAYGWIENRYFNRCFFSGPAVIFQGDSVSISHCRLSGREMFFPVQRFRIYRGFVGVRNCAFFDCVFDDNIGIGVPEDKYDDLVKGAFGDAEWDDPALQGRGGGVNLDTPPAP